MVTAAYAIKILSCCFFGFLFIFSAFKFLLAFFVVYIAYEIRLLYTIVIQKADSVGGYAYEKIKYEFLETK